MRRDYPQLSPESDRALLIGLLERESYAVVKRGDELVGLITRSDMLTANRNDI